MNQRAGRVCALDHRGHRLDAPDLVVGEADRNEGGGGRDVIGIRQAVSVHCEDLDGMALRLKAPDRTQHGLVLGGPGDDRPFRKATRGAEQRQVDGLGARCGERDLGAVGAEGLGGQVVGGIQRGARNSTFGVRARRVAVRNGLQRFANLGEDWRRAGVVQVDAVSRGSGPAAG